LLVSNTLIFFYKCTLIVLRITNTSIYLEFRVFDAIFNYFKHLEKIIRVNIYFLRNIVIKTCNKVSTKLAKYYLRTKELNRLIVGSGFGSNYWNRFNSTISTLEIDSKFFSIRANLKSTRFDSSRYSISILEIESNCQEIENNVIISKVTILKFVKL